jgi:putative ATPase
MNLQPLAERMRPKTLDEYVGQSHLLGANSALRRSIESGRIHSFILWGPPGVGKTTLAFLLSRQTNRAFYSLSAVSSGVKDVRETIEKARQSKFFDTPTPVLFIDEIHRFSKNQQDSLLAAVEQGIVTLIGATTENPSFEVITPLLSRCQVYILKSLENKDLDKLLQRAITEDVYFKKLKINLLEKEALYRLSGGDGRKLLNALEISISAETGDEFVDGQEINITDAKVLERVQKDIALYDKNGEQHYDIISAFIKSIRGSDPNAAVYWLARMLAGGEDVKFIARRMIISASEDIGLANANALLLANACFESVNKIGMPEARIILSQTAIYLATSPKSNSAYMAINQALELVENEGDKPVPLHLRNAPTKLMKNIGYGADYKYAHSYEGNFVNQEFMPKDLSGCCLYVPQVNAREREILNSLQRNWKTKYGYTVEDQNNKE